MKNWKKLEENAEPSASGDHEIERNPSDKREKKGENWPVSGPKNGENGREKHEIGHDNLWFL